jgi:Fe2+ transport system protein FeoA
MEKSLKNLKSGENGVVVRLNTSNPRDLRKLTAFGIVPGTKVNVIQKYPAIIVQIGFTQAALDNNLAEIITVTLN